MLHFLMFESNIVGTDLVDRIMSRMTDHTKSRRQVLRQLITLDLIGSGNEIRNKR